MTTINYRIYSATEYYESGQTDKESITITIAGGYSLLEYLKDNDNLGASYELDGGNIHEKYTFDGGDIHNIIVEIKEDKKMDNTTVNTIKEMLLQRFGNNIINDIGCDIDIDYQAEYIAQCFSESDSELYPTLADFFDVFTEQWSAKTDFEALKRDE